MTLQLTNPDTTKTESGFLLQSGNSLSGNLLIGGDTYCAGVGSAQGQVNGSDVALTLNQIGQTVNLAGAVGAKGSMSGSYSILASPCGVSQVGTWSAVQIQPLTGSFQATFASTVTSGSTFNFAGTVTEGQNTGSTTASLAGNMTSTDAPCFSSASISGVISGTAVVFNLLSSEGVALGQIHGTTTADASTTTGLYDFTNTVSPPVNGCKDFGTVTVVFTP